MSSVMVYCDGSGNATGGPGGVGYVAVYTDAITMEGRLPLPSATNQQAEILAAAFALDQIEPHDIVEMVSDSEYVVKSWPKLPGWSNGDRWRLASGGEVKNIGHWKRLMRAAQKHGEVTFQWVRGHDGNIHNERADQLAGVAREEALRTSSTYDDWG